MENLGDVIGGVVSAVFFVGVCVLGIRWAYRRHAWVTELMRQTTEQQEVADRQQQTAERQMEKAERQQELTEQILRNEAELQARWFALTARLESLVDRWERDGRP